MNERLYADCVNPAYTAAPGALPSITRDGLHRLTLNAVCSKNPTHSTPYRRLGRAANQAAPRTPDESPCCAGLSAVRTLSLNTWGPQRRGSSV